MPPSKQEEKRERPKERRREGDKDKDKAKTHKLSLKGSARMVAEFVSPTGFCSAFRTKDEVWLTEM